MKKRIYKILFIIFLICIYYVKDYFYIFLNDNIKFGVLTNYEKVNSENFNYENDIFNYDVTKILYRDVYNFKNEITILNGENENYKKNYPVIDKNGLLGFIKNTDRDSSKVTLLTNENINLSVKVGSSYGILKYIDKKLVLTNLTNENFKTGDLIYTSGYSKVYEGIVVGKVLKKDEDSLKNTYFIQLLADFNDINYLVVIKDLK